jgi:hypothetical protein
MFAGFFNSIMDVIRFKWKDCIFSKIKNPKLLDWISPAVSWKNKWKDDTYKEEKFLGSSTIFVFLTDLWHFAQFIMILCFLFAIILYNPVINIWIDLILMYFIFGGTFELFYSKIWNKKK